MIPREYPEICSNFSTEGFAHTYKKTLQIRYFRCYNGKKEEWKMIWIIGAVLFLILVVLVVSFVCYRMAFYAGKKEPKDPEKIEIPIGEIYEAFRPQMEQWV